MHVPCILGILGSIFDGIQRPLKASIYMILLNLQFCSLTIHRKLCDVYYT